MTDQRDWGMLYTVQSPPLSPSQMPSLWDHWDVGTPGRYQRAALCKVGAQERGGNE